MRGQVNYFSDPLRTKLTAYKKSNDKLRIAYAWNYREWGGAQMYFLGLARRLRSNAEITFILPEGTGEEFLRYCDSESIRCTFLDDSVGIQPRSDMLGKLQHHWRKLKSEAEMVKRLVGGGFDIFHVDLGPWQSLTALIVISMFRPTFFTMHNRLPGVGRIRRMLWRCKFFLAGRLRNLHPFSGNRDARDAMLPLAGKTFVSKTRVTCTNVNPDELRDIDAGEYDPASVRAVLGLSASDFLIVTVAQFVDRKGRWDLLEAAAEVVRTFPEVKFRWVTNSEVSAGDRARIEAKQLGDAFRVIEMSATGMVRRDVLRAVSIADLFVLPSLVEGLPIALMEALGLGIPVVATDINGVPEAVTSGENGVLVLPGHPEALAASMIRLIEDREMRLRLASNARSILNSDLTEPVVAELVRNAYASAVGRSEE